MEKILTVNGLNRYKDKSEIQVDTMPTAASGLLGRILQYVGTTTATYTNGYFYKCINNNGTYEWVDVSVQAGGSGGSSRLPFLVTGTLSPSSWENGASSHSGTTVYNYTQSISDSNVLSTDIAVADVNLGATNYDTMLTQWEKIHEVSTSAGRIIFTGYSSTSGSAPTSYIPVNIIIIPTV